MFKKGIKAKKGQGLTEYGIILVLVAVAAIGIFAMFGGTIRTKISQVTSAVSGDETSYTSTEKAAKTASSASATAAAKESGMGGAAKDDMKFK